jgi:hypothetical protein
MPRPLAVARPPGACGAAGAPPRPASRLIARLSVTDRALKDLVNQPQRACRQFFRPLVYPYVQLVRGQLLELYRADLRYQVILSERPVIVNRLLRLPLQALVEEVRYGIRDRVAEPGRHPSLHVFHNFAQPGLYVSLGPALALDSDSVTRGIESAAYGAGVAASLRIKRRRCAAPGHTDPPRWSARLTRDAVQCCTAAFPALDCPAPGHRV